MTPNEYKRRYDELMVPTVNGAPRPVRLNQYRLRPSRINEPAMKRFQSKLYDHGVNTPLQVHDGSNVIPVTPGTAGIPKADNKNGWNALLQMVFFGKGSPEHCQIVLQLAEFWNLANNGVQAYADDALGLDCNGFVGNYLWHGLIGALWTSDGFHETRGPNVTINVYFDQVYAKGNTYIEKWADLDPAGTYILGRANGNGKVIPQWEGAIPGHIAIIQPHTMGHFNLIPGFAFDYVRVVESTASHSPGLTETWYALQKENKNKRVFTFWRTEMTSQPVLDFKIAKVTEPLKP